MKKKPPKLIEKYRVLHGKLKSDKSFGNNGHFFIPTSRGTVLGVVISDGLGWDRVSVSLEHRIPRWTEMCFIKNIFFKPDEIVIQYHPAKSDYVNDCKYALHLWRPQNEKIPMPDIGMV